MKQHYKKLISNLMVFNVCTLLAHASPAIDTTITVNIDINKTAQTIDNIGTSACWFSEGIGKFWPSDKRAKIAQLLFSRKFDRQGNPEGIGVSSFRFNIGAGTAEQGDSSGIKDFRKRTECFLSPNGTYDWNKQAGYQYFLKKARDYGVETLIAFTNSPPVQFTQNGLGYKTEKDYKVNLRAGQYDNYARFLAEVVKHFDKEGIHFKYISPVNEPQWDWSHKYMEGTQEGSPWNNADIYKIVKALDTKLDQYQLDSKILVGEAGMLSYLYGGNTAASHQIQQFFTPGSALYMGNLHHVPRLVGGHSYFTESNDSTLLAVRKQLADTAQKHQVAFWETEYSMLADGYKEGYKERRTAMDCALFLAKMIHTDLSVANAAAWQFWNAYEPGKADFNTRYYLIALNPKPDFKDGDFTVTKNLWALGHYSLFVRPGMQRIAISLPKTDKNIMLSAYRDKNNKLVIVCINYGATNVKVNLSLKNAKVNYKNLTQYLTTADNDTNMKAMPVQSYLKAVSLPGRSISTMLVN